MIEPCLKKIKFFCSSHIDEVSEFSKISFRHYKQLLVMYGCNVMYHICNLTSYGKLVFLHFWFILHR